MRLQWMTITGDLGSGKSTVARQLATTLGMEVVSTGAIQRQIAQEMGMTTLELNKYAESHPEIDDKIDQSVIDLSSSKRRIIFDSRMAWHFVPVSYKVYLEVDREIAATRLVSDSTRGGERYACAEEAFRDLSRRRASEHNRFLSVYDVDDEDLIQFDLVINTSFATPEAVVGIIKTSLGVSNGEPSANQIWLPPALLIPTQSIRDIEEYDNSQIHEYSYPEPIEVIRHERCYFIFDGHARVSRALMLKQMFVPVRILNGPTIGRAGGMQIEAYLKSGVKRHWIYDWEALHAFRFWSYRCMEHLWT